MPGLVVLPKYESGVCSVCGQTHMGTLVAGCVLSVTDLWQLASTLLLRVALGSAV